MLKQFGRPRDMWALLGRVDRMPGLQPGTSPADRPQQMRVMPPAKMPCCARPSIAISTAITDATKATTTRDQRAYTDAPVPSSHPGESLRPEMAILARAIRFGAECRAQ